MRRNFLVPWFVARGSVPRAIYMAKRQTQVNQALQRFNKQKVCSNRVRRFLRLPGEREEAALAGMSGAPAVARVSAAAEAALKAEFGKVHDPRGIRLLATMQAAVVEHFAAKGLGFTDIKDMLVVSKTMPERKEKYWATLLSNEGPRDPDQGGV